jgi:hypothetical protein
MSSNQREADNQWLLNHTRPSVFGVGLAQPASHRQAVLTGVPVEFAASAPPIFNLVAPSRIPSNLGNVDRRKYEALTAMYVPDGAGPNVRGLSNPGPGLYMFALTYPVVALRSVTVEVSTRTSRVDGGLLFRVRGSHVSGRDPASLALKAANLGEDWEPPGSETMEAVERLATDLDYSLDEEFDSLDS